MRGTLLSGLAFAIAFLAGAAAAPGQTPAVAGDGSNLRPFGFGPDQRIVEVGRAAWEPLRHANGERGGDSTA